MERARLLRSRIQQIDDGASDQLYVLYRELRPYIHDDDWKIEPDDINDFVQDSLAQVGQGVDRIETFDALREFASDNLNQLQSAQLADCLKAVEASISLQRNQIGDLVDRVETIAQHYFDQIHRLSLTFRDLDDRVRALEQPASSRPSWKGQ